VGTHAKHAHRAVPSHSAFGASGHCHDAHNRRLWLVAPDKPHGRLPDRAPLADPNGPAHAVRCPAADCLLCSQLPLKLWWSAEMDRLTYSEWQLEAALPRMVRRTALGQELEDINVTMRRRQQPPCAQPRAAADFKLAEAEATARTLKLPNASVLPQCQCAPQAQRLIMHALPARGTAASRAKTD
jgi:hypothetical protein